MVVTVKMVIAVYTVHKPPYIPKSRRNPGRRLLAQWLLVLKSWIKPFADQITYQRRRWHHRLKYAKCLQVLTKHASQVVPATTTRGSRVYNATRALIALTAIAMSTESGSAADRIIFDTDSEPIGVDNRCSASMSHRIEDFVTQLTPTDLVVKGVAGSRTGNVMKGPIQWK